MRHMQNSRSPAWAPKLCAVSLLAVLFTVVSPMRAYAHTGGNHKKITDEAANVEGYSEAAIKELLEGNLKVDDHKGTFAGTPDNPGANAHEQRLPWVPRAVDSHACYLCRRTVVVQDQTVVASALTGELDVTDR